MTFAAVCGPCGDLMIYGRGKIQPCDGGRCWIAWKSPMHGVVLLLGLALAGLIAGPARASDEMIIVNGVQRTYILEVPARRRPARDRPARQHPAGRRRRPAHRGRRSAGANSSRWFIPTASTRPGPTSAAMPVAPASRRLPAPMTSRF